MSNTTQQLNFAAFSVNYQLFWVIRRIKTDPGTLWRFLLIIFTSLGLAAFTFYFGHGYLPRVTTILLCIVVFLVDFCLGMRVLLRLEGYEARLAQFAADNHFIFAHQKGEITHFHGAFSQLGRDHMFKNRVSGVYQGLPFECGTLTYTAGKGKTEYPVEAGLIRVTLTRKLPHILLDSRDNNLFGVTNMPWMHKMQRLQLEGNFNKYFDLFVPKDYERDALYVLTPELMAILIEYCSSVDVEMVDTYLHIYFEKPPSVRPGQTLRQYFSLIQTVGAEIQENTARYRDSNIGKRAANEVAQGGRRLKRIVLPRLFTLDVILILLTFVAIVVLGFVMLRDRL